MFHVPAHKNTSAPAAQTRPTQTLAEAALLEGSDHPRVAVVHEPTLTVVHRCATIAEAEAFIAELDQTQPEAVERGDYGIDAPEDLHYTVREVAA